MTRSLGTSSFENYRQGFQTVKDRVVTPRKIPQPTFGGKGRLKPYLVHAPKHSANGYLPFQAGQGRPQTKVRAEGKGQVPVLLPGDV